MKHFFKFTKKTNKTIFHYSIPIFLLALIFIFIFSCPVKIFSSQPYGESDIVSGVVPLSNISINKLLISGNLSSF
jgi:ABC-type dipeptide/oligopeptide/nickel transport system permease component